MNKQPFFSVVISVFNKQQYIERTIKSVLAQTFTNFEIIVVDDGSEDNSLEIINSFEDSRTRVFTDENRGASFARNFGIKKASANYIALLDGDDIWHPTHLENMFNLIKEFPEAGIYCSGYEIKINQKHIKRTKYHGIRPNYKGLVTNYFECNIFDSIINSSVVVIYKFVFDEVGYFNEKMKSGQDTLMWVKIALKFNIAVHNTVAVTIIKNEKSLSHGPYIRDRLILLDKFQEVEIKNKSLKKFLDMNRYAIALSLKRNNDSALAKTLIQKIDRRNLNLKQKTVLYLPNPVLRSIYILKKFLDHHGIYVHLYR